jgi:hypothetical protein
MLATSGKLPITLYISVRIQTHDRLYPRILAILADSEKVLAATYLRHPDVVRRSAASHPRIYSGAFHLRPLLSAPGVRRGSFYRTWLYLDIFVSDGCSCGSLSFMLAL